MITDKADTMPLEARTVTLTLPSSDYSLLCSITDRLGWTISVQKPRKTRLQLAIEEAHKGPLYRFDSVEEMMKHLMSDED